LEEDVARVKAEQDKARQQKFEEQRRREEEEAAQLKAQSAEIQYEADRAELELAEETTQQKIERARAEARGYAADAVDTGIDTLVNVDRQLEQTREGNRQLHAINETVTEAEKNMAEMEKGLFSISGSGKAVTLPPLSKDDTEIPFQQWKNMFTRYHRYKMRFCNGCIMRINHTDELKDTASYKQIASIEVKAKAGFIDINFTASTNEETWTCYLEDTDRVAMVKEMAQRKYNAGMELNVTFETGATRFDYNPTVSAADRTLEFSNRTKKSGAPVISGGSKFQQMQAENDAFMNDMLGELDTIGEVNEAIGANLRIHTAELKKQQELVEETNNRTKALNKRADTWLSKN